MTYSLSLESPFLSRVEYSNHMRVSQDVILLDVILLLFVYRSAYIRKTRSPLSEPFSIISLAMDKTTSVVAALKAGKQPTQLQIDAWIDKLLQSELIQVEETPSAGELSQNGKKLARDLRGLLEAYKNYLSHKNGTILTLWAPARVYIFFR
jgi:hypothetical protein